MNELKAMVLLGLLILASYYAGALSQAEYMKQPEFYKRVCRCDMPLEYRVNKTPDLQWSVLLNES